jgi:membrane-associated phospholipid phosphatase
MDDRMQQAVEQAYRWEHGDDPTIFPIFDALHGSLYHQFMVVGTILADKRFCIVYLLALIVLALVVTLPENNLKKRRAKIHRWIDVIGVYVLTLMIGGLLIHFVKHGLSMPRPYVGLPPEQIGKLGSLVEKGEDYMSFPSGHAAFATIIAASLWPVLGKTGKLVACLFVFWVACSRVALGLHYPRDVIGGIVISLVVALIIRTVARRCLHYKDSGRV